MWVRRNVSAAAGQPYAPAGWPVDPPVGEWPDRASTPARSCRRRREHLTGEPRISRNMWESLVSLCLTKVRPMICPMMYRVTERQLGIGYATAAVALAALFVQLVQ